MARDKTRIFQMKQFSVSHALSSNKVGVDGVLIGAWTTIPDTCHSVLDVGCGCGLISLMLAQRIPDAKILGIDIEPLAVKEAISNCANSPWPDRLDIQEISIDTIYERYTAISDKSDVERFDLIISNPPFFNTGIDPSTCRTLARHVGSLSPDKLIMVADKMLSDHGRLSFITVAEDFERLCDLASHNNLRLLESMYVRGNPERPAKRVMMSFIKNGNANDKVPARDPGLLTIENTPGSYTEEYKQLCAPFYLKL